MVGSANDICLWCVYKDVESSSDVSNKITRSDGPIPESILLLWLLD